MNTIFLNQVGYMIGSKKIASFLKPGQFQVYRQDGREVFSISDDVYEVLFKDLIKALYFQRCGCALEEKHAGIYQHAKCHAGITKIFEHQEIEKEMCGGWHDAGMGQWWTKRRKDGQGSERTDSGGNTSNEMLR